MFQSITISYDKFPWGRVIEVIGETKSIQLALLNVIYMRVLFNNWIM